MALNNLKTHLYDLASPDGKIVVRIMLFDEGRLEYSVTKEGEVIFENSPLGIFTSVADFTSGLSLVSSAQNIIFEDYAMIGGKKSIYNNYGRELILKFKKKLYIMYFIIRVYNDGIAYRYYIPGEGPININFETSSFRIPAHTKGWAQDFVPSYEDFYDKRSYEELLAGNFGMPILLNNKENWVLISEAAVYGNYCGSHIEGSAEEKLLKVIFAPDQKNAVMSRRPLYTPWRVAIIGSLADIVESTLIENLNPDCEITDISWIKPGRCAWSWWSGDSTEDYETQAKYVDFAHKMGWEYYLCDAGWKPDWLPRLVAYAWDKNIGIFVWYHYKELQTDDELYEKLSWLAGLGVKGIKVDFFESDSQERIQVYDKIAEVAAKYRLMVVYHGATKPAGERRRWPHILTREGILGAEHYKWSDSPTAEHNCTVPFTRNAVGPMDYTPVTYSQNKNQTTWAHQTALPVIFESNIQHLADRPESYESVGDAIEFLKACPATWDDTKLIEGYPGRFVTIARKYGDNWFIGSICGGNTSRNASIPLYFLEERVKYLADIYMDGDTPSQIIHKKHEVTKSDVLNIYLKTNGGCAIKLEPIK